MVYGGQYYCPPISGNNLLNYQKYMLGLLSLLIASALPTGSYASVIQTTPSVPLQQVLDSARSGDRIELASGVYRGNFTIKSQIHLKGLSGAVLDGVGKNDVIRILAPNVTIEGLEIYNWGDDLTEMNSGVYVESTGSGIQLIGNTLEGDGFGYLLENINQGNIRGNTITGNPKLRSADRGNGIQLSNVQNITVSNNVISNTRDGIYIISSQQNQLLNNHMRDLRYGIHYMYSNNNQVIGNEATNTRAGYALMSSKELLIENNYSYNSQDYGLLMNYITQSEIRDNYFDRIQVPTEQNIRGAEGKGVFIYNSQNNMIRNNQFSNADLGIHLTAGSEGNILTENAFINNKVQVKYVSSRNQEWSYSGRGNYWNNYLGWDLNDDGIGDAAYEPNDGMDKLLWTYPQAKVLSNSPAVLMLRWVQRSFPVLRPQGVKDSFPLMEIPQ